MKEFQLEDAKATLSAVVDDAISGTPSVITRGGRKVAVIVSFEDYQRLANLPSFGRLLAALPAEASDIPQRRRRPRRAVDL